MLIRQKNVVEWILLILCFIFFSSLESSILSILPLNIGNFHIAYIIVFYVALTRSWYHLSLLSFLFAYLSTVNSGVPGGVQIAALMWIAYFIKIFSYTLSFENRYSFVYLNFVATIFVKSLIWILMNIYHKAIPFLDFLAEIPGSLIGISLTAYLMYPIFVKWDQYFEHEAEDARDFNPSI